MKTKKRKAQFTPEFKSKVNELLQGKPVTTIFLAGDNFLVVGMGGGYNYSGSYLTGYSIIWDSKDWTWYHKERYFRTKVKGLKLFHFHASVSAVSIIEFLTQNGILKPKTRGFDIVNQSDFWFKTLRFKLGFEFKN